MESISIKASEYEYEGIVGYIIHNFSKIITRCKNVINNIDLPDRTRIFISAIWFWAYILYYITKLINGAIGIFLHLTPDSCIIFSNINVINSKDKNTINKPIILDARLKTDKNRYEIITNKIRSIINNNWDVDIGNDNSPFDETEKNNLFGGMNIRDIINVYPTLSSSIVWISYIFETEKKINSMTDAELGKKIKHMLINFTDKTISRTTDMKTPEKIIVGEIIF